PDEIYNRPANLYVADFIGSPAMNFITGTITGGRFHAAGLDLPLATYPFLGPVAEGTAVVAGIRPEHVVTGELVARMPVQVEAVVDLVEPMGSDTLVWVQLASQAFRVRMDGQAKVRKGEPLRL